jgi:D-alanine-D-alanine ligase
LRAARNSDKKIEVRHRGCDGDCTDEPQIRFKPAVGYSLYAARDIKAGEVLVQWEERAQHLVTKQWVEKNWNERQKAWFDAYAYLSPTASLSLSLSSSFSSPWSNSSACTCPYCLTAWSFPLIGDTYVMWSDKVADWKPLNHSCDPNSWLEGLNQVARRDIKKVRYPSTISVNTRTGPETGSRN